MTTPRRRAFALAVVAGLAVVVVGMLAGCARKHILDPFPIKASVMINLDAPYTRSEDVEVEITTSGFDQIRLAESPAALSSAAYDPLRADRTADFTLTGPDGTKTIYAQLRRSSDGGESAVYSDDIILDRAATIDSVEHDAGAAVKTAGDIIHFRIKTGETDGVALIDIDNVKIGLRLFDDGTHGDVTAGDGTYEINYAVESILDVNSVPVSGRFTDAAGNRATSVQSPILLTIQNPPPAVTLVAAVPQGRGKVLVQWTQSSASDFASYRVWHAPTSPVLSSPNRILAGTVTSDVTTTFTTDSIAINVPRHFLVEVVDIGGNGTASNELTTTPTLEPQPVVHAAVLRREHR